MDVENEQTELMQSGDGSFHWIGVAGHANPAGTPGAVHTPFFIASITGGKVLIATRESPTFGQ